MEFKIILFVVFIPTCLSITEDVKEVEDNLTARKFRSSKVNQLWEKAERMELSAVMLSDLYVDLKEHDRKFMDVKTSDADENDKRWRVLNEEFNRIMVRYGLAGNRKLNDNVDGQPKSKQPFQDPQLNKLWLQTVSSKKFKTDELDKLLVEFKHHEDKVWELDELRKDLERVRAISENSVERFNDKQDQVKREAEAKTLQEEVETSFQRLHLVAQKSKDENVAFIEPRVAELWEMAQNGNFTVVELLSVKQELHHFENRINKHKHFRDQLKNSAEKLDFHGEGATEERVSRHQKLQGKVQDLGTKVKKLFGDLKSRLSTVIKHKEL
uniref:Alpha-2-macroglobulin RAP C-terminal domain-containing protein n=1 Tax=Ciona savignyi TaxID=51511 RepID=H2ZJC6_CIOSA